MDLSNECINVEHWDKREELSERVDAALQHFDRCICMSCGRGAEIAKKATVLQRASSGRTGRIR